jgi:hypothetical protein
MALCSSKQGSVAKFDFGLGPDREHFAKGPSIGPFSRNKMDAFCFRSKLRNRNIMAALLATPEHENVCACARLLVS